MYSEKGPWTQVENKVNYQDRDGTKKRALKQAVAAKEEYKFKDSDSDEEDLLGRGKEIADLKNALKMGVGIGESHGIQIRKNFDDDGAVDGECDDDEDDEREFDERDIDKELLKKMFLGGMSGGGAAGMNLPGATPMNTQMDDD